MRRIGIGLAALLVVLGAAYWGLGAFFDSRLRSALDQSIAKLPAGYKVTYQRAHYSPFSARAEIDGLAGHMEIGGDAVDLGIDHVELIKPNLELSDRWNEATSNPASWPLDKALPVADRIASDGIHMQSALQSVEVKSWRVDGLRVYPGALLHPGLPSLVELIGSLRAMAQHQPPTPELLGRFARLEAAVVLGMGYDTYEMADMKASGRTLASAQVPDQPFSYQVAHMSSDGVDRGVAKNGSGENFIIAAPGGGLVKAARFAITGLDVRKAATALVEADSFSAKLLDGIAIKRIEYSDLSIQPPDGGTMALAGFSLSDIAVQQGEPVSLSMVMKGFVLDRSRVTQPVLAAFLDQGGLGHLTIGLGAALSRDTAAGKASLHDTFLTVDELGSLDLSAEASDEPLGGDPAKATLTGAVLNYRDASLADRLLRVMARGGDPESARNQLILVAQQQGMALGPSFAAPTAAVVAFLKNPRQLTVKLGPPQPVTFGELAALRTLAPEQIADLLGLQVLANQ